MPWCDECAKFWNPPSRRDGACPSCGARLETPSPSPVKQEQRTKAPWHFKLLLVSIVVYLGYRGYQGIAWLVHHL